MRRSIPLATLAVIALAFACTGDDFPDPVVVDLSTPDVDVRLTFESSVPDVEVDGSVSLSVQAQAVVGGDTKRLAGVPVQWRITSAQGGEGEIVPVDSATNASGTARATWHAGQKSGGVELRASIRGAPAGAPSEAKDSALIKAGAAVSLRALNQSLGTAVVATVVDTLRMVSQDKYENYGTAQPSLSGPGTTDLYPDKGDGIIRVKWQLGTKAGPQKLTATLPGLTPVVFSVTATAGPEAKLIVVGSDTREGPVNSVPDSLVVQALDAYDNVKEGAEVTFTANNGSLVSKTTEDNFSTVQKVNTNAGGRASALWKLGREKANYSVSASILGGAVSQAFRGTATTSDVRELRVVSGGGQGGTVKTELSQPIVVRVQDEFQNVVPGAVVTFATSDVGGGVDNAVVTTDNAGLASTRWTLGQKAGPQTLTASTQGATADSITATAAAGVAAKLKKQSGDNQTDGIAGKELSKPLVVLATDQFDNPKSGVVVTFAAADAGFFDPASVVTGTDGLAQSSWNLGQTKTGQQTAEARAAGLAGSPITFTATASANPDATRISVVSGSGQSGTVASTLSSQIIVKVTDDNNNAKSGVAVTFAGDGSFNPSTVTSGTDGLAGTSWTLGTQAGGVNGTATANGARTSFSATAVAGPANKLTSVAGSGQSGEVGQPLGTKLRVRVTDIYDNAKGGVTVTFTTSSGGSFSPATPQTGSTGEAEATWTLGSAPGAQSATATVAGVGSVSFSATATVGGVGSVTVVSGSGQTKTVGQALSSPLVVVVKDDLGNPVPGQTVTFATSNGGSFSAAAQTGADGQTQTTWTLGTAAGTQTATATAGGRSASFTATATPDTPANLTKGGDGQSGTVGTPLGSPLTIRVTDQYGNPNPTTVVTFATTGGGSFSPAAPVTDANGQVSTTWTLGPGAGSQSATATVAGLSAVTFTATAGTGARVITLVSGDSQAGTVAKALAQPLKIVVKDNFGNAIAGVTATFTASGNGSVSPSSAATAADGSAQTTWTLGTTAGSQTVTVTVPDANSKTFSATAVADSPSQIQAVSGSGQSATVGQALAAPLVVRVRDQYGNQVQGASVGFTTATGSLSPASPTTGSDGLASTTWTLGTTPGSQTAQASVAGVFVQFTATAVVGSPASVSAVSGTGQTKTVGQALDNPLVVVVRDQYSNPVPGVTVTFATPNGGSFSAAAATGSDGRTQATWTLGTTAGAQTGTASVAGVATPASFTATGTAADASSITVVSGNGQTGTVGQALASPLVVEVKDQHGNPKSGATVTFATPNGGSFSAAAATGSDGRTQATWTLGTTAGAQTATASVAGVATPASFTATGTAAAAASITAISGTGQTGPVGQALTNPLVVEVRDQFNNLKPGATVTFSGDGSFSAAAATGANGRTQSTWTLGGTLGAQSANASVAGVATPASFAATGTVGAPASVTAVSGTGQSATVGQALASPLVVAVKDAFNNPVTGVTVTFATTGGGSFSAAAVTNASGETQATWTLGTTAGAQSATASVAGVGTPASFSATGTAAAAASVSVVSGSGQAKAVGQALDNPLVVVVRDAFNNPVSGATVTFATPNGGSFSAAAATNASGQTQATWTLGTTAGAQSATASVAGVGTPASFSATATAGDPASATKIGDGQAGTVSTALASPIGVTVLDAFGNAVSGVTVTFSTTDGSIAPTSVATNGAGQATATWTLGATVGGQTATVTVPGLAPVTINATGS